MENLILIKESELRQIIREEMGGKEIKKNQEESPKKYVYGLAGIRKLFNVSHATAQKYKDTIIADAVSQQGRKIIVDVDKALELFKKKK